MERLQRVLSASGLASRRRAEELIREGRVRVDGQVITEMGVRVDPTVQKVELDGKIIPQQRMRYLLLNKPAGYITTTADERDRRTVMDLIDVRERVVPVGRLDRPTEGLLLLTNDGDVAHRVMHPSFNIEKEYEVLLDGHPPRTVFDRLSKGVVIDGEPAKPTMVRPARNTDDGTVVRIALHEGRNRIVRRMFEAVNYPVLKLRRVRIGPLQLGTIPRGTWRDLTDGELAQLREALRLNDEDVLLETQERLETQQPAPPPRSSRPVARRPQGRPEDYRPPGRAGGSGGRSGPPGRGRPGGSPSRGRDSGRRGPARDAGANRSNRKSS
jgi:23S rRNA pseudouridine2605 synthase